MQYVDGVVWEQHGFGGQEVEAWQFQMGQGDAKMQRSPAEKEMAMAELYNIIYIYISKHQKR